MSQESAKLFAPIATQLVELEARIEREIAGDDAQVADMARDIVCAGGKRLRPALVLLVGQLGLGDVDLLYDLAIGVELIHTATLIHDDLIDHSPVRRGVAAVHTVSGPSAAIIIGDHYLAKGLGLVARGAGGHVAERVAETVMAICAGELAQMRAGRDLDQSPESYEATIARKTAGLLRVCSYAGAVVAGLDVAATENLSNFGHNLGMAFQIADDLLDYAADAITVGKPVGADIRQGTVTLPLILALAEAHRGPRLRALLAADQCDFDAVVALVRESGAMDMARRRAGDYADHARLALADFGDSAARQSLLGLCDYVVMRKA